MQVTINKTPHDLPAGTSLLEAISPVVTTLDHTALAVNHRVIPRDAWPTHQLCEGDAVTIITAAMGG